MIFRRLIRWLYVDKGWGYRLWISWIFSTINRDGVTFPWKGDEVWWLWWWKRDGKPKYISVAFSGRGEFGDACFATLKELDAQWDDFHKACAKKGPIEVGHVFDMKDRYPDVFGDTDYR